VIGFVIPGETGWSSQISQLSEDFNDPNAANGSISIGISSIVRVTLANGCYHEDVGYGIGQGQKTMCIEKAKKEAVTDATKRALRLFGNKLGNSVYDKEHIADLAKKSKANTTAAAAAAAAAAATAAAAKRVPPPAASVPPPSGGPNALPSPSGSTIAHAAATTAPSPMAATSTTPKVFNGSSTATVPTVATTTTTTAAATAAGVVPPINKLVPTPSITHVPVAPPPSAGGVITPRTSAVAPTVVGSATPSVPFSAATPRPAAPVTNTPVPAGLRGPIAVTPVAPGSFHPAPQGAAAVSAARGLNYNGAGAGAGSGGGPQPLHHTAPPVHKPATSTVAVAFDMDLTDLADLSQSMFLPVVVGEITSSESDSKKRKTSP
jgi:DNA recombination protein Rad52